MEYSLNTDVETDINSEHEYTLTVVKVKEKFAINVPIKIVIDKTKEYVINDGETINIAITRGKHNLAFSGSIRNKIIDIDMQSNTTLKVKWDRVTGELKVDKECLYSQNSGEEISIKKYNTLASLGGIISTISLFVNFFRNLRCFGNNLINTGTN